MKRLYKLWLLLPLAQLMGSGECGHINVNMDNFRNNEGKAVVALFKNAEGFPGSLEKAEEILEVPINNKKSSATLKTNSCGNYAIIVIHDENGNRKMDTRWPHIPLEGYGVSNNTHAFFSPPNFDDAHFRLDPETKLLTITLRY